jgi:hypothetical protein
MLPRLGMFTFHFMNEIPPTRVSYYGNILKQLRIFIIGPRNVGPGSEMVPFLITHADRA